MASERFCGTCGRPVHEQAVVCVACGVRPSQGRDFCQACGSELNEGAEICVKCGVAVRGQRQGQAQAAPVGTKSQGTTFLLSFLLGLFGADRFYLGQTGLGILKLLTFGGCCIWWIVDYILTGIGSRKDAEGNELRWPEPVGEPKKSQTVAFLLSAFLGGYGVDRFYLGYTGLGIAKLLTLGGCGIWSLIDLVLIGMGSMTDAEGNSLARE